MSPRRRAGRKILVSLLPIILVVALALVGLTVWLVYGATHPPRRAYLVTPEKFVQLSDRGLKATEETWSNRDGTSARGWLVRGAEGSPAIVLLHRYGADRSWLLNLGVKLNETTNMTVLLPDLRGHGENSPAAATSFGALESDDLLAAIQYLRGLKSPQGRALVGERMAIGLSTHSPDQIASAEQSSADYYAVGPVHETPTKPGRPAVGLELVRHAASVASKPWFAIGGIDAGNVADVAAAGATRVVVVRAIRGARDPAAAARALRAALVQEAAVGPAR